MKIFSINVEIAYFPIIVVISVCWRKLKGGVKKMAHRRSRRRRRGRRVYAKMSRGGYRL